MTKTREYLKEKFKTNAHPTQQDFYDLFESFLNFEDDNVKRPGNPQNPIDLQALQAQVNALEYTQKRLDTQQYMQAQTINQHRTNTEQLNAAWGKIERQLKNNHFAYSIKLDNFPEISSSGYVYSAVVDNDIFVLETKFYDLGRTTANLHKYSISNIDAETDIELNHVHEYNINIQGNLRMVSKPIVISNSLYIFTYRLLLNTNSLFLEKFSTALDDPGSYQVRNGESFIQYVMEAQNKGYNFFVDDNKIFVVGGGQNNAQVYFDNPVNPLPFIINYKKYRCAISHYSSVYIEGKPYIIGGKDEKGYLDTVYHLKKTSISAGMGSRVVGLFVSIPQKWYIAQEPTTFKLNTARAYHSSVAIGNIVYVIGGKSDDSTFLDDIEIYRVNDKNMINMLNMVSEMVGIKQIISTLWTLIGKRKLPEPRAYHNSFVIGNKIYVIGGRSKEDGNYLDNCVVIPHSFLDETPLLPALY